MQTKVRVLIIIILFFICAVFISFKTLNQKENNATNTSGKLKLENYLTQYNPDFHTKGIMKSSFKHEVEHNLR
jgi:hypothetical protein